MEDARMINTFYYCQNVVNVCWVFLVVIFVTHMFMVVFVGNCWLLPSCLSFLRERPNFLRRFVIMTTRSSADADKPARRVWRSVKVTKHSTIWYVRYSFLLCNSNFVFKTRRFYDIRLQKMSWPWNGVKGHSRSLRVVSFHRLCMVSY